MAVVKLTELIQNYSNQISEAKMVIIIDSMLNHLDSDDKNLQNNSVKCLVEVISKLSTENCHRVVDRIVTRIVKPENKQTKELVDLYANGLVTIIKEVGHELGYQLKELVKMTVDAIFKVKSQWNAKDDEENVTTQLHLINIA
jgi:hypothetical protein